MCQRRVLIQFECASYSFFHCRTVSKNFSRPRSCLVWPVVLYNRFSTTLCVDIPAWSNPGTKRVVLPNIRFLQHQNIKTDYMKSKMTSHDSPSNQRVLDRNGKSVSDMQATGDIGRRESHNEGAFWFRFPVGGHLGREKTLCIPPVVPSGFDSDRVVPISHFLREVCKCSLSNENVCSEMTAPFF